MGNNIETLKGKITEGKLKDSEVKIEFGKTAYDSKVIVNDKELKNVSRVEIIIDARTGVPEFILYLYRLDGVING